MLPHKTIFSISYVDAPLAGGYLLEVLLTFINLLLFYTGTMLNHPPKIYYAIKVRFLGELMVFLQVDLNLNVTDYYYYAYSILTTKNIYLIVYIYIFFSCFYIKSHQVKKRFPHGIRHFQKIWGSKRTLSSAINVPLK